MQKHVLDDGVGALAVLNDLLQIVLQEPSQFIDFFADLIGKRGLLQDVVELIRQFR